MKFPEHLPIQGGVPIVHQDECVGAIGVSGVPTHEDERVASGDVAALAWEQSARYGMPGMSIRA
jgi:glc operon protein GlcG